MLLVRCVTSGDIVFSFFFSSRRRHTRYIGDWSSDVCSSDLDAPGLLGGGIGAGHDPSLPKCRGVMAAKKEDKLGWRASDRSEERRVGKECRARGWRNMVRAN